MSTTRTATDDDRPRVLTVVSCGATKLDLKPGETVRARDLYSSGVHTCKDRYARHSDAYYIMSAKHGLIHCHDEIGYYDRTLDNMSDLQTRAWGRKVALTLQEVALGFDAVVLIGSETYVGALEPHFGRIPAAVLTPWQTDDYVSGVGRGMSWCNDESNWPVNVSSLEEIGVVVSE